MSCKTNTGQMDLTDRIAIETGICRGESFRQITKRIQRHPSTVAHEVKENRTRIESTYCAGKDCKHAQRCTMKQLCGAEPYLIGFEIIVLFILGWVLLSCPAQIVQVTINFICSMQYNTFRQAEGVPMATTFVTNHIRQTGIWAVTAIRKKDAAARRRAWKHFLMVTVFFLGGLILTLFCSLLQEKVIWLAMIPLAVSFIRMVRADLVAERQMFDTVPLEH